MCGHSKGGANALATAVQFLAPGLSLGHLVEPPNHCSLAVVTFGAPNLASVESPGFERLREELRLQGLTCAWELAGDPVPALLSRRVTELIEHYQPKASWGWWKLALPLAL